MPANELGTLRRSQVITTFGPGAIVDFRSGGQYGAPVSAAVAGLEQWEERATKKGLSSQVIHEPRLEHVLGVAGFRLPPVKPERKSWEPPRPGDELIAVRFPKWLQCPRCERLKTADDWNQNAGRPERICAACSKKSGARPVHAVPVRFITACEAGHLDEFPWHSWVNHKPGCGPSQLRLRSRGGSGLANLILKCDDCKAERSMDGCFGKKGLQLPCRGRQPWLQKDAESCSRKLRTLQRGASNLYFPLIYSALDIPPWSDPLQNKLSTYWEDLLKLADPDLRKVIEMLGLHERAGLSVDELLSEVELRKKGLARAGENLKLDEYRQLGPPSSHRDYKAGEFETKTAELAPELAPYLATVTLVTRLREVRALKAFTRINSPDMEEAVEAPIAVDRLPWLPATEVRGEGIFLMLNEKRLERWQSSDPVLMRCGKLAEQLGAGHDVSPKHILIHTFAHALIRSIALDCGYSTSSLRERLYTDTEMSGVLIYTATPDSDGTLGGLVRQGTETLLLGIVRRAVQDLRWCASDPLCINGTVSLSEPANYAACHNCVLLPETSCEGWNHGLDRGLLIGTPDCPEMGYLGRWAD